MHYRALLALPLLALACSPSTVASSRDAAADTAADVAADTPDAPAPDAPLDVAHDAPAPDVAMDHPAPDAPPPDAPTDRPAPDASSDVPRSCTADSECRPFFCGCGRCDPASIVCVPDARSCPLACPIACPELATTTCRCLSGGFCERASTDAGAPDAPPPDVPPPDAPADAGACTPGGGCHAYWCGCGRCNPAEITCTPDMRGCPLACASACPELDTAVCRCEGGRCGAPMIPDAGAGGLPEGADCGPDATCAAGLMCCYPCGIPGCHDRCMRPMGGHCPLLP